MRRQTFLAISAPAFFLSGAAFASEVIYSSQGELNRFNATQSGLDNLIGAETTGNPGYIYPWDYNAAQQVGANNSADVSQSGVSNQANFKQGRDNVHSYDSGYVYSFGSVTEASFNSLSLSQTGNENIGQIDQLGNHNRADTTQNGSENLSQTAQWGDLDRASTSQFGIENQSFITQSDFNGQGGDKTANVHQNGIANYAYVHQYEDYYSSIAPGLQTVSLDQVGSSNLTTIYQSGSASTTSRISGDSNSHNVNQRAIAPFAATNQASVSSFGDFNAIQLNQGGLGGNRAEIEQTGVSNGVILNQNRQDGIAQITQAGNNNLLSLTQNGVGNSFMISMAGNSHSLSLTQY